MRQTDSDPLGVSNAEGGALGKGHPNGGTALRDGVDGGQSRRTFDEVVGAGVATGTLLGGATGTAAAEPIVVDDFDGDVTPPTELTS